MRQRGGELDQDSGGEQRLGESVRKFFYFFLPPYAFRQAHESIHVSGKQINKLKKTLSFDNFPSSVLRILILFHFRLIHSRLIAFSLFSFLFL